MNLLYWIVAQAVEPWSTLYSDVTHEWDNVDIVGAPVSMLVDEYDTCCYELRREPSIRRRYWWACRLALIMREASRQGYTFCD